MKTEMTAYILIGLLGAVIVVGGWVLNSNRNITQNIEQY